VQEAAAVLRDHGRKYGRRRAECRTDPSRRDEIFERDRGGEITPSSRRRPGPITTIGGRQKRFSTSTTLREREDLWVPAFAGTTTVYFFAIAQAGSIGPNASSPEILARIL